MKDKDGGPAFPVMPEVFSEGMSLRDYFAGQALMGLLSNGINDAKMAYATADAMLKEREK